MASIDPYALYNAAIVRKFIRKRYCGFYNVATCKAKELLFFPAKLIPLTLSSISRKRRVRKKASQSVAQTRDTGN